MSNGKINKAFLNSVDSKTRNAIVDQIAKSYGISKFEALDEVTSEESEHLLDYLVGEIRSAASVLMQRKGLWSPAL